MTALVLNPHAHIVEVEDDAGLAGYRVTAPVRGRGARIAVIHRSAPTRGTATVDPALFAVLQQLQAATEDIELSDGDEQRLASLGLLIDPAEVSTPVMYACTLDLDDAAAAEPRSAAGDLVVNRSLQIADRLLPPAVMPCDPAILARWAPGLPIAWVTDEPRQLLHERLGASGIEQLHTLLQRGRRRLVDVVMAVVVAGRLPHRFVRQPGRVTIERAPRLLREIRIDRVGDHDEAPGAELDTDLLDERGVAEDVLAQRLAETRLAPRRRRAGRLDLEDAERHPAVEQRDELAVR